MIGKLFIKLYRTLLPVFVVLMSASCVHQYPETVPADAVIKLVFDTDLPYYRTLKFPDQTEGNPILPEPDGIVPDYFDLLPDRDFSDAEKYDIRYILEAYRQLFDGSYSKEACYRRVFIDKDASSWDDHELKLTLDEGNYKFRVWADFVEADNTGDLYYAASDFSKIALDVTDYQGNIEWREAYMGEQTLEVVRYGSIAEPSSAVISMSRPTTRYMFITNDLEEFKSKVIRLKSEEQAPDDTKSPEFNIDDYKLRISSGTNWMPSRFSIPGNRPNFSLQNVSFESKLIQISDTHAILAFDTILSYPVEEPTVVRYDISLIDKDGTELATHRSVRVDMRRGKLTFVEGRFLMQESSGGISINPGFDGPDIIHPI